VSEISLLTEKFEEPSQFIYTETSTPWVAHGAHIFTLLTRYVPVKQATVLFEVLQIPPKAPITFADVITALIADPLTFLNRSFVLPRVLD